MSVTKDQLTAKRRGRPGSIVRVASDVRKDILDIDLKPTGRYWVLAAGEYEVCDLFDRKSYDRPGLIGIVWRGGLATSVRLDEIELVR